MTHELYTPDGQMLNLKNFSSEKEVIRFLKPKLDELMRKYPYHPNRTLTGEELDLFKTRLLIQQWFLKNHAGKLINSNLEYADVTTGDFVDDAEISVDKMVNTEILTQNLTLLSKNTAALVRWETKTYGLDINNKLIDLRRLWEVPHTTQGIEEKNRQN